MSFRKQSDAIRLQVSGPHYQSSGGWVSAWDWSSSDLQQVPGFFVEAVFGFFQVGRQDYCRLAVGGKDGEDVPGVGGDDEGGEEVELVGAVEDVAGTDGADVGVVALIEGAFDLHAEEEAVVVGGDARRGRFLPRAC